MCVELLAHLDGSLPVVAELSVEEAKQTERTIALAATPSEIVVQEVERTDRRPSASLLRFVLFESAEVLDFMRAAAQADRCCDMVEDFADVGRSGEGTELDNAVREELAEVDHATSAGFGCTHLVGERWPVLHGASILGNSLAELMGVVIEMTASASLSIDRTAMPLSNVRELLSKLGTRLIVGRANDAIDADSHMHAARLIDLGINLIEEADKIGESLHSARSAKDRRDEFSGHAASGGTDACVTFGAPAGVAEAGGIDDFVRSGMTATKDGIAIVISAYVHIGAQGDGCFDFDSEGGFGCFVVLVLHNARNIGQL